MAFDIEGYVKRIDAKLTTLLQESKKETWVKVDTLQQFTVWDNRIKLDRARRDNLVKTKKEGNVWLYSLESVHSFFLKPEYRNNTAEM